MGGVKWGFQKKRRIKMSFFIQIMFFVGFGIITIGCGGAAGNRIVLSSESAENSLIIPSGDYEGTFINKQKLAKSIAEKYESVLNVHDISIAEESMLTELFAESNHVCDISFSVTDTSGNIHKDVRCNAHIHSSPLSLHLYDCANNEIELAPLRIIPLSELS